MSKRYPAQHFNMDGTPARHFQKPSAITQQRWQDEKQETPTMKFNKVSDVHYWTESRTVTLATHDLTLGEYGWECDCEGFHFKATCEHVRQLVKQLYGPTLITPARLAVQRAKAEGISLVSLMDYTAPPAVTNRRRVQAPPSYVCARCAHENEPGAVYCEVCGAYPVEASLKQCS